VYAPVSSTKSTLAALEGATTVLLKSFQPWLPTLPEIDPPVALLELRMFTELGGE
jgi:hypothetical protein